MALLLMHANATVTICHSKTRDLPEVVRRADIVVAAIGRAAMVEPGWVRPGATVIDVGINRITDAAEAERIFANFPAKLAQFREKGSVLVGDVHPGVAEIAGAITPVPGGVGPLTIAMLMSNTVKAARLGGRVRRRSMRSRYTQRRGGQTLMLRVGLTGGIATGKSTVAAILSRTRLPPARSRQDRAPPDRARRAAYDDVVREFGRGILTPDGRVDRAKLGAIVFADPKRLARLNAIVHPPVLAAQDRELAAIERAEPHAIAVVEAALLIEAGYTDRLDCLVVTWCTPEQQLARLTQPGAGRGLTIEQARQRIAAQMPLEEKRRMADEVIDCSGSLEHTREQTVALFAKLRGMEAGQFEAVRSGRKIDMTKGKDSRGVLRLLALGLVLVLGAYWAGSRWGQRQPERVEAVPAAFPEPKATDLVGDEVINVKIYSQAAPAVANIVTRNLEYDVFMEPVPVEGAGSGFRHRSARLHSDQFSRRAGRAGHFRHAGRPLALRREIYRRG